MVRFFSCTNVARLPSGLIEIYNVSVCCGCVECVLVLYMYLYNYIVCVIVCMQLYYCEESVWPLSGAMTMTVREGSETSMGEIIRIIHVNHWCYLNWLKLPIASAKWNEYTLVYFCQFSLFLRCVNVRRCTFVVVPVGCIEQKSNAWMNSFLEKAYSAVLTLVVSYNESVMETMDT